jgi:hypothetical protein
MADGMGPMEEQLNLAQRLAESLNDGGYSGDEGVGAIDVLDALACANLALCTSPENIASETYLMALTPLP